MALYLVETQTEETYQGGFSLPLLTTPHEILFKKKEYGSIQEVLDASGFAYGEEEYDLLMYTLLHNMYQNNKTIQRELLQTKGSFINKATETDPSNLYGHALMVIREELERNKVIEFPYNRNRKTKYRYG